VTSVLQAGGIRYARRLKQPAKTDLPANSDQSPHNKPKSLAMTWPDSSDDSTAFSRMTRRQSTFNCVFCPPNGVCNFALDRWFFLSTLMSLGSQKLKTHRNFILLFTGQLQLHSVASYASLITAFSPVTITAELHWRTTENLIAPIEFTR
jgi:hypothetical protein